MHKGLYWILLSLCCCWQVNLLAEVAGTAGPGKEAGTAAQNRQGNASQEDKQQAGDTETPNPFAHLPHYQITAGQALPALLINDYGEVIAGDDNTFHYQPWHSQAALKRVQLIHYLAGRRSASKRHKNFTDQLEALKLDSEQFHITTIINANDAFLGTSKMVASRLDNSKREHPLISVVGDKTGLGAYTWSLKPRGSAIIMVDRKGVVFFFREDKFTQQEIDSALELLQQQITQ